jgi:hypothetical protein
MMSKIELRHRGGFGNGVVIGNADISEQET